MEFKIKWSGKSIEYSQEEIDTVVEVMKHGDPQTQGNYLRQFEADFSDYLGGQPCFGVTNATHALELIADLVDIKEGDEVIIPAHTYCASAIPFGRVGGKIVWADIDPDTFLISLDSIKDLISESTKVIVVVHLYGQAIPNIKEIVEYAHSRGILVVEDCAQSLGATIEDQPSGTFGDFSAFSFHAQKNVTTLGEGGIMSLKDNELAKLVPGIRHNGHAPYKNKKAYWLPAMSNVDLDLQSIWPHNFSLTEAQAALGSQLIKRVPALTIERQKRADRFKKELSDFPELVFQKASISSAHSYHLMAARYDGDNYGKNRDDLIGLLSEKYKIQAIVQYYPLYRYDLFKKMGFESANCPNTDHFFDNMISFPFHITLSEELFQYMIDSIKSALAELRA
jgi:perosamine synthetase